jgi:hypothetical protein
MKTLQTLTAALLITLSFSAFATDRSNEKLKMDYTVNTYIDAISHGKVKDIASILDDNAKFTLSYGDKIVSYSKAEMIRSMQANKNIEQNCVTEYSVIEEGSHQTIIKVTMKYDGFSRVNLVNLANTSKGWKITNISSSFN